VSSWEIHPVYAMDVCTKRSLRSCRADDDTPGLWTALEVWEPEPDE